MQVDLHGAFGEFKPLRYFLVGQTFRHYPNDLAFTRSERFTLMVSYPGYLFKVCDTDCSVRAVGNGRCERRLKHLLRIAFACGTTVLVAMDLRY